MIRRLRLDWPGPTSQAGDAPRPIRLLAISDERAPTLDSARNRDALGRLDVILGAGDLEPDYLGFLGDAFHVPLVYVRGNHDRGGAWTAGLEHIPPPLENSVEDICGLAIGGLSWPGPAEGRPELDDGEAWWQALGTATRSLFTRRKPKLILSHVPPRGLGDAVADPFHRGFAAYHWLCRRLHPRLWLHGHTTLAAADDWRVQWGDTTLVNVTGGVLIELVPAAADGDR